MAIERHSPRREISSDSVSGSRGTAGPRSPWAPQGDECVQDTGRGKKKAGVFICKELNLCPVALGTSAVGETFHSGLQGTKQKIFRVRLRKENPHSNLGKSIRGGEALLRERPREN